MRTIHTDDVDTYMGPASVKRPLSTDVETENVSINYFELEPGESFALGYHSHANQEEIFYVLQGTATFETGTLDDIRVSAASAGPNGNATVSAGNGSEDGESSDGLNSGTDRIEVEAGEAIRFAPGEYQCGHNESAERVVALAIGAPRDAGETDIRRECPTCREYTAQEIEMTDDREALLTRCGECGGETGRFD